MNQRKRERATGLRANDVKQKHSVEERRREMDIQAVEVGGSSGERERERFNELKELIYMGNN